MSQDDATQEPLQPLSWGEKTWEGVKGFFKTALHSLPRTLLYSALFLGGSYLLGNVTHGAFDPLGATKLGTTADWLLRIGASMALGSAISGAVGAYQGVTCACDQRNAQIAGGGQPAPDQVPQQQISYAPPHVPQADLPSLGNAPGKHPPTGMAYK